jgi:uncharacterized membrane protein
MFKGRKAASEVVASLVILLIVSILGSSLYSFSITTMMYQQENMYADIEVEIARSKESYKVIHIGWDGLGDDLNVMILNYGQLDLKISEVYVNGAMTTTYLSGRLETIQTTKLANVVLTSPVPIIAGSNYEIVLASQRGVSYVSNWTP